MAKKPRKPCPGCQRPISVTELQAYGGQCSVCCTASIKRARGGQHAACAPPERIAELQALATADPPRPLFPRRREREPLGTRTTNRERDAR